MPSPDDFFKDIYQYTSLEQTAAHYAKFAANYEAAMAAGGYVTPGRCAEALAESGANKSAPVLDIGCGLGYSSAVLSRVCRAVISVESDEAMAKAAEETLSALGYDNAAVLNSALSEGADSEKPFEVILLQGGVGDVPQALLDQLAEGGRLVAIWMEGSFGQVRVSTKTGDAVSHRWIFDAAAHQLPGFAKEAAFAF